MSAPRVLGVVPARGGSKGVPRKNLAPVGGVPLVVHALRHGAAARTLARTVVSTDDAEIAAVARAAGGDVPFLRPAELARDDTPTLPVLLHALAALEAAGDARYEYVCILQPTNPLRRPEDVDACVELALATGADSVVTVCPAPHPAKLKRIVDGRLVPYVVEETEGARRQDLGAPAWRRNGAVYVIRRKVLASGRLYGDDCRAVEMPAERSVDVDGPGDLRIVEALWETLRGPDAAP